MNSKRYKPGDLQVFWIPQVPMEAFVVDVASVAEGMKILDILASYDLYQFQKRIKPDYCNIGGLRRWVADIDGRGTPGWEEWYDEERREEAPLPYTL